MVPRGISGSRDAASTQPRSSKDHFLRWTLSDLSSGLGYSRFTKRLSRRRNRRSEPHADVPLLGRVIDVLVYALE